MQLVSATTYPALVGQVLADVRKKQGLSQSEISELVGVGQSGWSKIERGDVPLTIEQLAVVAHRLNTTPGALLLRADEAARYVRGKGLRVLDQRAQDAFALGLTFVAGAALGALVVASLGRASADRE